MSAGDGQDLRGRLREALHGASSCLILTHDNPDPDALASAFALEHVLEKALRVPATVAFSGMIGRAENRAMVQELGIVPEPLTTVDIGAHDAIALVDTQPASGNNSAPVDRRVNLVVDHHPARDDQEGAARCLDIRPDYGSTATILTEYARILEVELPVNLATALFYALKSETQDLGREAAQPDRQAYFQLLELADMRAVARIQRARVPREYFQAFRTAIDRAMIHGSVVLSELGTVPAPDIVAEMADFLLRLQDADWSCCLGRHHNNLVVSLRTSNLDAHAGHLIRRAVEGLGTAGGHGTMAGGQVPVSEKNEEEVVAEVRRRLLERLEVDDVDPEPLLR